MSDLAWEAEGDGPPALLLVHPGLGDRSFWDLAWPALTSRARAIRFDQRGFGASPDPVAPYAPAADAAAVLDAAGSDRAVAIGVSFGARVALDLAAAHPERVAALVLASGPGAPDAAMEARFDEVDAAVERGDLDGANAIEVDLWAGHADARLRAWLVPQNRALLERQAGFEHEPTFGEPPEALGMPVLVLLGEHDVPSTIAGARATAERLGAEVVTVPGAGHLLGREAPEAFLAAVEPFVRAAWPSA